MKKYIGVLFLLWIGALIVLYYVVQKPGLLNIQAGLLDTLWTLLVAAILLFNAYGLGRIVLQFAGWEASPSIGRLIFSFGIGLAVLGLLGLIFSAVHLATTNILTVFQVTLALFFILRHVQKYLRADLGFLRSSLNLSFSQYCFFSKTVLFLLLIFVFLLTFLPPFEDFDALLYHLVEPARILQDGGLHAINIPPFWYPNLMENVYLWTLALAAMGPRK